MIQLTRAEAQQVLDYVLSSMPDYRSSVGKRAVELQADHMRIIELLRARLAEPERHLTLTKRDTEIEQLSALVQELDAKLAKHEAQQKEQEPVAWKFYFNNRTEVTVNDAKKAHDIRRYLQDDEREEVISKTAEPCKPSGSFVAWDNTMCNPLADTRTMTRDAWEDGYASAPPQREWKSLTDDEIGKVCGFCDFTAHSTRITLTAIARGIEDKLKEKNA